MNNNATMLKRRIKTDLTALALILSVIFAIFAIGYRIGEMNTQEPPRTYTMNGVYIDEDTIATVDGNRWHYFGDNANAEDLCTVTFDNNNTPHDKTDDEIIDVIVRG
jgi:hypothetical protein